ncbi:MAG: hypothetical protein AB1714_27640 [Acidobacteriota bacterium]
MPSGIQGPSNRPLTIIQPQTTASADSARPRAYEKPGTTAATQTSAELLKDKFEVVQSNPLQSIFTQERTRGPAGGLTAVGPGACNIELMGLQEVDDVNKVESSELQGVLAVMTYIRAVAQTVPRDVFMSLKNGTGNLVGNGG